MAALIDTHATTIRLHSVPWNDYTNVPDWSSRIELDAYFDNNYVEYLQSMTIVRPDMTYDFQIDINTWQSKHINYMTFDNGNGRYYAFVKNPRFVALNNTRVDVEIDVWTTYLHRHTYSGIITRAHVDRWKAIETPIYYKGDNENIGEPVISKVNTYSQPAVWVAIYCSEWPTGYEPSFTTNARYLGGALNTLKVYLIPIIIKDGGLAGLSDFTPLTQVTLNGVQRLCGYLGESKFFQSENIYCIQVLPYVPFAYHTAGEDSAEIIIDTGLSGEFVRLSDASTPAQIFAIAVASMDGSSRSGSFYKYPTGTIPTTLPTSSTSADWKYEGRLWSAPYYTCVISNYEEGIEVDPANIDSNFITWTMPLSLGANDYGYSLQVSNYSNDNSATYKTISGTTPNRLSWATDKFYNYMVQNSTQLYVKNALNVVRSSLSNIGNYVGMGAAMLTGHGGIAAATHSINPLNNAGFQNQIDKVQLLATAVDSEKWPKNVTAGAGNPGLMMAGHRNRITCTIVQANDYVLETKGSEFIQFGYEINKSATNFNYRSRYWFNFVQYADCVCTSPYWLVPEHKTVLENIYKNGVRIWHYRNGFSQFGKYNLDNTEV